MIALGKIMPVIVRFLRTELPQYQIHSHIPVNAKYPLVRLGLITQEPWYALGNASGCTLELELEVWSNEGSSKPCILMLDKISEVITGRPIPMQSASIHIINSVFKQRQIMQTERNSMWCGTITWQLWLEQLV